MGAVGTAAQIVHPIRETSYDEPAGIFGINCGHEPETFIDGISVPRYAPLTSAELEQDNEAYLLTQKQRALERQVRQYRTEAVALHAAGQPIPPELALKVKAAQGRLTEFCKTNGLTERLAGTQVMGYNRSVGSAVGKAARNAPKPVKAKSGTGRVKIPDSIKGDFSDFSELSLTDEERTAVLTLLDKTKQTGFEHGAVLSPAEKTRYFTSGDQNSIRVPADLPEHSTILHSHPNSSPPSGQDFRQFAKAEVDRMGVVGANGDVFLVSWPADVERETAEKIRTATKQIRDEVNSAIRESPNFENWTFEERNYMAIREQAYLIARYFKLDFQGGNFYG